MQVKSSNTRAILHNSIVVLSIIFTAFLENKKLQVLTTFLAVFAAQKDHLSPDHVVFEVVGFLP